MLALPSVSLHNWSDTGQLGPSVIITNLQGTNKMHKHCYLQISWTLPLPLTVSGLSWESLSHNTAPSSWTAGSRKCWGQTGRFGKIRLSHSTKMKISELNKRYAIDAHVITEASTPEVDPHRKKKGVTNMWLKKLIDRHLLMEKKNPSNQMFLKTSIPLSQFFGAMWVATRNVDSWQSRQDCLISLNWSPNRHLDYL